MTAVMLVMAPPMPTSASGGGDAVETAELAGDGRQRLVQPLPGDGAAQPELAGEPHGADVDAELLVDGVGRRRS